jgi:hypothetical protein
MRDFGDAKKHTYESNGAFIEAKGSQKKLAV